jgi:hypothetical protein
MLVQGWEADENGEYGDFNSQNIGDVTLKQEINAQETDSVRFGKNLDASIMNKLAITGEQDLGNGYSLNVEETDTFNEWGVTISDGTFPDPTSKELTLNEEGNISNNPEFEIDTNGDGVNELYTFDNTNGLNLTKTIPESNINYSKMPKLENISETDLGNGYTLNIDETAGDDVWNVTITNGTTSQTKSLTFNTDGNISNNPTFEIDTNGDGTTDEIYSFDSNNGLILQNETGDEISSIEYSKIPELESASELALGEGYSLNIDDTAGDNYWDLSIIDKDGVVVETELLTFDEEGNINNNPTFEIDNNDDGSDEIYAFDGTNGLF